MIASGTEAKRSLHCDSLAADTHVKEEDETMASYDADKREQSCIFEIRSHCIPLLDDQCIVRYPVIPRAVLCSFST